jgi:hypothetical protein
MIYLPNFADSRVIAFCVAAGQRPDNDGFYKALRSATGATGGVEDLWKIYLTQKYGAYKGPHIANYEKEESFTFAAGYTQNWVLFNGSTSLLRTGALTGVTASGSGNAGTVSFWVEHSNSNVGVETFSAASNALGEALFIYREEAVNTLLIEETILLGIERQALAGSAMPSGTRRHLLYTWDFSPGVNEVARLYMNGVLVDTDTTIGGASSLHLCDRWSIGDYYQGGFPLTGKMADFYYNNAYTAPGSVTSYYNNGAVDPTTFPTGKILFKGNAAAWGTNQGTGGSFSILGSLSDTT